MSSHHSSPVSSLPHHSSPWASGNGEFFHTHIQFFLTTLLSRLAHFFQRVSHAIQGPPPLSTHRRDLRARLQPLSRRPRPRSSRPPSADRLRSRLADFAMQSHPTPSSPRIFLNHSTTDGCALDLPAAIDPLPSHLPTPKDLAPRVLVLDDEEAICMLITCALSPHGYEVTEALDGMTAIAHYKEAIAIGRPFDLVISDLTLPEGLSGAETISQLRAIDPFIRAIVSSGQTHDPILTRFEDYGFTDRITKPYQLRDLVAKVASVLNSTATPDQRKKFEN